MVTLWNVKSRHWVVSLLLLTLPLIKKRYYNIYFYCIFTYFLWLVCVCEASSFHLISFSDWTLVWFGHWKNKNSETDGDVQVLFFIFLEWRFVFDRNWISDLCKPCAQKTKFAHHTYSIYKIKKPLQNIFF